MKIKTSILLIISIITLSFLTLQPLSADTLYYEDIEEKFVIDHLDVTIDVQEDGIYKVREVYDLNFHEESIGIYRNISTDYKMNFNNKTSRYYFPVSSVKITENGNTPKVAEIHEKRDGIQLIIGGDNYYEDAFIGKKQYEIEYEVQTSSLNNGVTKEGLFYNILPREWGTIVKNLSATINMPKDFDSKLVQVKDCYEEENFTIKHDKKSLYIKNNEPIGSYCGVTVYQPLADDYFTYKQIDQLQFNPLLAIAPLFFSLIILILIMQRRGRKKEVFEVVTFNPPKGFNSTMVAEVANNYIVPKDIYSLLFEWANKGYIVIEEKGKNNLNFKKLSEINPEAPEFERRLFYKMFPNQEVQSDFTWNKRKLYNDIEMTLSMVPEEKVIKEMKLAKSGIYSFFAILAFAMSITIAFTIIFNAYYYRDFNMFVSIAIFMISFLVISLTLVYLDSVYKKNLLKNKGQISLRIQAIIIVSLILFLTHSMVVSNGFFKQDLSLVMKITIYLYSLIALALAWNIETTSDWGYEVKGEILGLYRYIKLAKEDELIAMQEENPHLYYDVLPYAYVFGMSDLWLDKFKNISIPKSPYYQSYKTYSMNHYMMNQMIRSMTATSNQISAPISPVSSSKGGGSFSLGGGSFSGGGGFGGGGGGSR